MVEEMEMFPGIFNAWLTEMIREVHHEKIPYDNIYFRPFNFLK